MSAAHPTPDASPDPAVVTPDAEDVAGEAYYREHGWSGCAGSAWDRLPDATKDGWRHANYVAAAREADRAEVDDLQRALAKRTGALDMAIASAKRRLDRAEAAEERLAGLVAQIKALHRPDGGISGPGAICVECTQDFGTRHEEPVAYPCATIRALIPADAATALDGSES